MSILHVGFLLKLIRLYLFSCRHFEINSDLLLSRRVLVTFIVELFHETQITPVRFVVGIIRCLVGDGSFDFILFVSVIHYTGYL